MLFAYRQGVKLTGNYTQEAGKRQECKGVNGGRGEDSVFNETLMLLQRQDCIVKSMLLFPQPQKGEGLCH